MLIKPFTLFQTIIPRKLVPISWFGVGLTMIIIVGLVLRLASYRFGLPFVEWNDEAHLYWYGQCARGLYDPLYCAGYPIGYLQLSVLSQLFTESLGHPGMAPSVEALRLLGVVLSLGGIFAVGRTARLLAGDIAGLISAALWAFSSLAIEYSMYAIPESITIPLSTLAVMLAVTTLLAPKRWSFAILSFIVALFATLFDYRIALFCLPGPFVLLLNWLRLRYSERTTWFVVGILGPLVLFVLATLFYFFILGTRGVINNALIRIVNVDGLLRTIALAHEFTIPTFAFMIYSLGTVAIITISRRDVPASPVRHLDAMFLCVCLALVVCVVGWSVDWDVGHSNARIQNVLPASAILCVLIGCSISYIGSAMPSPQLLKRITLAALAAGVIGLALSTTLPFVADRRLESSHVALRHWADANLSPGTIVVSDANHKTFNPYWGGIPHQKWFDWWVTESFTAHTAPAWRQMGMSYMVIPLYIRTRLQGDPNGSTLLSSMLPMVEFKASMGLRGPEVAVYRLWRMEHELAVQFGPDIELIGYDGQIESLKPGDTLRIRLYWRALRKPRVNYSIFFHLLAGGKTEPLAQIDGPPAIPSRPTSSWTYTDETIISQDFELVIPSVIPIGQYNIIFGLYDSTSLSRLPVNSTHNSQMNEDAFQVARFTVP